jgi:hypothetical protein
VLRYRSSIPEGDIDEPIFIEFKGMDEPDSSKKTR